MTSNGSWPIVMDNGPVRYYYYDRPGKKASSYSPIARHLKDQPLQKMHSACDQVARRLESGELSHAAAGQRSKDGDGRPEKPVPMVLNVHGGPWARDGWGFNPEHQLLANRGYAVLSVNYRGSTGFGKKFVNAGNKEWAGKMHDDLIDAIDWADQGEDRRAGQDRHHGRQLWRLCDAGGPDVYAGQVCLRRGYRRPLEPGDAAENDPAVLAAGDRDVQDPRGRSHERRGAKASRIALAVERLWTRSRSRCLIGQGANDPRVKQARGRSDRQGDEGEEASR